MPSNDSQTAVSEHKIALRDRMRRERLIYAGVAPPIIPPGAFLDLLHHPGVIASYVAIPGEADPTLLATAAYDRGWTIALPHVTDRTKPMRFLAWEPGDVLLAGPFDLRQPPANAQELRPDIVLTPLVAFDPKLNRLGQGAGYYDRAFAALPAVLRIGIAWSIQGVDALPADAWDVPLHGVIDEYGWNGPEMTP